MSGSQPPSIGPEDRGVSPAASAPPPSGPALWRRVGRGVLAATVMGLALIVLLLLSLRLPPVGTRFANTILSRISLLPGTTLTVKKVRGDWLTHLELQSVSAARADTVLVGVESLRLRWRPWHLVAGRVDLSRVELKGVTVAADLARAASPQEGSRTDTGPPPALADVLHGRFYAGPSLRVEQFVLRDGRYGVTAGSDAESSRLTEVSLTAHGVELGTAFGFAVDSLALRYTPSGRDADSVVLGLSASLANQRFQIDGLRLDSARSAVSGQVRLALDALDSLGVAAVELQAAPLVLADLGMFLPALAAEQQVGGEIQGEITLRGARADRLSGTVRMEFEQAQWRGLSCGRTRLDAELLDGRAEIELATEVQGTHAEVRGWMRPFDSIPHHELTLQLSGLPRRLPGVPWWDDLAQRGAPASQWRIEGDGFGPLSLDVHGKVDDGASHVGLEGRLEVDSDLTWELKQLTLEEFDVARWAGNSPGSSVTGTIRARGQGTAANSLHAAASWDLAPSRYGSWTILSGNGMATITGDEIGGRLQLDTGDGEVVVDTLTAHLGGEGEFELPSLRFRHLDLARGTDDPEPRADLNGSVQVRGAGLTSSRGISFEDRLALTGLLVLEPSLLRDRSIERGRADLELRKGSLEVTATIATDAGAIDLSAETRPFDGRSEATLREARFADLDVGAWAGGVSTRLNGRLSGEVAIDRTAEAAGGVAGSATLRLAPSLLGSLDLSGAEADVTLSGETLQAQGSLRMTGSDAEFEATATLADGSTRGHARLQLPFGLLRTVVTEPLETEGDLRVDVEFAGRDRESATASAELRGRGRWGDCTVDSLSGTLRLAESAVTVDALAMRSNVGEVDVAGRVLLRESSPGPPSDLRLQISVTDPGPLRALLGGDGPELAEGRLEAHLTGRPANHAFDLRSTVGSLTWNDVTLLTARAQAQGVLREDWRPVQATVAVDLNHLRTSALRLDTAKARAALDHDELGFDLAAQFDDEVGVSLLGSVQRDSVETRIQLNEAHLQANNLGWELTRPTLVRIGHESLAVDSLEVRADAGFAMAHGTLDRRGQQDFRVQVENVGLDAVARWVGREDLTGRVDGHLTVSGPANEPRVESALRIDAIASGIEAGAAAARLQWDGRQAGLQASFASPAGDSLTVVGHLPLGLSLARSDSTPDSKAIEVFAGDVDLHALAHRFPLPALAWLLPPRTVSELQGVLDADLRLFGNSEALLTEGQVQITDAAVQLPSLGVHYQDVELEGVLAQDRFLLRRAHMKSQDGILESTGEVRVPSLTRIEPDVAVSARDFVFVDRPDLRAQASGDLHLTGTLTAPVVQGRLTLNDCTYYLTDEAIEGAQSSPVVLTPADIRMMEETFGDQTAPADSAVVALYGAADLDLEVSIGRNNWVRKRSAPRLALEIAGEVHVRKPPHGELDLRGHLAPVSGRGYVEHFGRTFDFAGGEVQLNGPMQNHSVDIRTEYRARARGGSGESDVVVHLDLQAQADQLNLTLSSEPPLPESEIISYITTGRTPTSPTSSRQGGADALALATDIGLSQVTGSLEDLAQEKVGLDVLQMRYDSQLGPTLVAGRYVVPNVYIGFQQPIQYREEPGVASQNPYRTTAEIEVELFRWLVVNLQGEVSLLRSFIRASHEY